jgi:hypothetical protein
MKRLFTFGCSYTSYAWPTWSNLISKEFDYYENWGLSGLGNRAIAERVNEANIRHSFTSDDVIIVQWSTHLRNDYYVEFQKGPDGNMVPAGWKTRGSIFNYLNSELYDKKWIDNFFSEVAYFMHTLNFISMTQSLLESTGCTWYMTSIGDIRELGHDLRPKDKYGERPVNLREVFGNNKNIGWEFAKPLKIYEKPIWEERADHWLTPLEKFSKDYPDLYYEFETQEEGTGIDPHPSTSHHFLWVEQELESKLNLSEKWKQETIELTKSVNELQMRMKTDKAAFIQLMSRRGNFPQSAKDFYWPTQYVGF